MILAAIAAAAALSGPPMRPELEAPFSAAQGFYDAYLGSAGAFPGPRARARLRPYLSPRLAMLLEEADRAEARHARYSRGREPPLLEGDVFTSLFEGAGRFQVQRCRSGAARAICQVALGSDPRARQPVRWNDQLVLVRSPGGWQVDDVVYGGRWAFANRGRLSQTLRSAIVGG
jgi:hypothetical protein